MAIYSGFTHQKWWFSIAMLVYQRVNQAWLAGKSPKKLVTSHGDFMYWESWGFLKDGRGLEEKLVGASSSYAALVWWCLTTRGHFWHFLASLQWTPLRIQDLADFCCGGEELPPDSQNPWVAIAPLRFSAGNPCIWEEIRWQNPDFLLFPVDFPLNQSIHHH